MMKKDIAFPAFIKDPVKLNKYYEKVRAHMLFEWVHFLERILDLVEALLIPKKFLNRSWTEQWRSKLDNWGGPYSYIRVHRP